MITRRTFLGQAAATPLIFGMGCLTSRSSTSKPDWFETALRRMMETGRCGVVIVVPEGEKDREFLAEALTGRLEDPDPETRRIFCEAVFVCLTRELCDEALRGAEDRFLLDPEGRRLAADTMSLTTCSSQRLFVDSFRAFIRGKGNSRLRERAEALGDRITPEIRDALAHLDDDSIDARETAAERLVAAADAILPYLVWRGTIETREDLRARYLGIVDRHIDHLPERRLPYGCTWPSDSGYVAPRCSAVARCGLAAMVEPSRRFLTFLTR